MAVRSVWNPFQLLRYFIGYPDLRHGPTQIAFFRGLRSAVGIPSSKLIQNCSPLVPPEEIMSLDH